MAKPAAKPKISKTMWTVLLIAGATVVYVVTSPTGTPAKKTATLPPTKSASTAGANGFLPEDYKSVFPRYTGGKHDAFVPLVLSTKALVSSGPGPNGFLAGRGMWVLTGITMFNGQPQALVENSTLADSRILAVGDKWNGGRVTGITDTTLILATVVNGKDQRVELTFPSPEEDAKRANAAANASGIVSPPPTIATPPPVGGAAVPAGPFGPQAGPPGAAVPTLPGTAAAPGAR